MIGQYLAIGVLLLVSVYAGWNWFLSAFARDAERARVECLEEDIAANQLRADDLTAKLWRRITALEAENLAWARKEAERQAQRVAASKAAGIKRHERAQARRAVAAMTTQSLHASMAGKALGASPTATVPLVNGAPEGSPPYGRVSASAGEY